MEFDLFGHGLRNLHVPKYVRGSFVSLCLAVGDVCGPAPTSAPVENSVRWMGWDFSSTG